MLTGEQAASADQPAQRMLVRAKSNLGPSGDGFQYDIQHGPLVGQPGIEAARVVWGERIYGRARELMEDMGLHAVPGLSATDQATARWLCALLQTHGPMPVRQVVALAERDGIKRRATVDLKAIFPNREILHNVPREDVCEGWGDRMDRHMQILLEVNDRTINVYMRSGVLTNIPVSTDNPNRRVFREELILAWTKTY